MESENQQIVDAETLAVKVSKREQFGKMPVNL